MYSSQPPAVSHNATPWVISLDAAIWALWINFALFNKFHCCSRHFLKAPLVPLLLYYPSILFPHSVSSPLYTCGVLPLLPQSIIAALRRRFPYHLIFLRCTWLGDTPISLSDLSDLILQHYILKVLSDRFSRCPFNSHTEAPSLSAMCFLQAPERLCCSDPTQHDNNSCVSLSSLASYIFLFGIVKWLFHHYLPKEIYSHCSGNIKTSSHSPSRWELTDVSKGSSWHAGVSHTSSSVPGHSVLSLFVFN